MKKGFAWFMTIFCLTLSMAFAVLVAPVLANPPGRQVSQIAVSVTPEMLAMVVGVIMSLAFSYLPGVASWYNLLSSEWKRVIMLIMLAAVSAVIYGLACGGVLTGIACSQQGVMDLVQIFIAALIANQSADRVSPKVGLKRTQGPEPDRDMPY